MLEPGLLQHFFNCSVYWENKKVWGIKKWLILLIREILYTFIYHQRKTVKGNPTRWKNRWEWQIVPLRFFLFLFCFPLSEDCNHVLRPKVKSITIIMVILLVQLFLLISQCILQICRQLGSVLPTEQEHMSFSRLQMEDLNMHTCFKQILPGDSGWTSPDMSSLCPHSKLTENWAAITKELLSMS